MRDPTPQIRTTIPNRRSLQPLRRLKAFASGWLILLAAASCAAVRSGGSEDHGTNRTGQSEGTPPDQREAPWISHHLPRLTVTATISGAGKECDVIVLRGKRGEWVFANGEALNPTARPNDNGSISIDIQRAFLDPEQAFVLGVYCPPELMHPIADDKNKPIVFKVDENIEVLSLGTIRRR